SRLRRRGSLGARLRAEVLAHEALDPPHELHALEPAHGNRRSHDHLDLSPGDLPGAGGKDFAAAADDERHDRELGLEREHEATLLERQEVLTRRGARAFGEDHHRDALEHLVLGSAQARDRLLAMAAVATESTATTAVSSAMPASFRIEETINAGFPASPPRPTPRMYSRVVATIPGPAGRSQRDAPRDDNRR